MDIGFNKGDDYADNIITDMFILSSDKLPY